MADGHLNFDTRIDEKGFNKGINKLSNLGKGAVKTVGAALAGVTAALGAGAAAGVKYNATIEQYQTSFEVMTGSAEKAEQVVQKLTKLGASTPFEMVGLADTTQLLMNYGFTADDAMDKMMMLGDISQGSADKMNRIAMAYGQMSSAGKVQLEDVKQMIEAGFNPLQEISDSTGESMESLYDRISKGTLSVDEITASMERSTSAGGKYFQSMEKQSQTVSGQLSTLKDNAMQLLGSLSSGISETLGSEVLPTINEFLGSLNESFASGGISAVFDTIATSFQTSVNQMLLTAQMQGPQIITNFCNGIVAALPNLIAQGGIMLNNLLMAITANLPAIIQGGISIVSTLIIGIAQQLPTLIPTAIQMLLTLVTSLLGNIDRIIDAGIRLIVGLAQGLINAIPQLINKAPTIIGQLVSAIIRNAPKILQAGIQLLGQLAAGLIRAVPQLIGKIPSIITQIKNAFTSIDWGSVGRNIIEGIGRGLANAGGAIVDAAKSAAKKALDAAKNFLGIHSPSRVFRDQVGKMMALGLGIGFEKNVPVKAMNTSLRKAVDSIKKDVAFTTSAKPDKSVGRIRRNPIFSPEYGFDYDRFERIQRRIVKEQNRRPIFLGTDRIDRPLPKGAVPQV